MFHKWEEIYTRIYFANIQEETDVLRSGSSLSSSACGHRGAGGLAAAAGLPQTDMKAQGREAPLGKGAAVNYLYSLEMTYLSHSVSYLPSGLSSQTSESYKHNHFFIFGDRRTVEGDAMRSEGGEGEGRAEKCFGASSSRSGGGRPHPILEGLAARPASSLLRKLASQSLIPGLRCIPKGKRFPLLQFDHFFI